jgi:hypothetical protein
MDKQQHDEWQKSNDAADAGYDPKPWQGVAVHSQNTPHHEFVKFVVAWVLDDMGRSWATETVMDDGRVDVFDYGPTDGKALVYEVETGVTKPQARRKVEQYCKGPVRDVIVIDPADVPKHLDEAIEYIKSHVVIG